MVVRAEMAQGLEGRAAQAVVQGQVWAEGMESSEQALRALDRQAVGQEAALGAE